jgi:hypothetical protein
MTCRTGRMPMYARAQAIGEPGGDASRARDTLGRRTARAPTPTATATAEDQRDRSHGTRGLAQVGGAGACGGMDFAPLGGGSRAASRWF